RLARSAKAPTRPLARQDLLGACARMAFRNVSCVASALLLTAASSVCARITAKADKRLGGRGPGLKDPARRIPWEIEKARSGILPSRSITPDLPKYLPGGPLHAEDSIADGSSSSSSSSSSDSASAASAGSSAALPPGALTYQSFQRIPKTKRKYNG